MSKYKSKTNAGTPEVHSARSKLDGVLKTLVDKKEQSPVLDHQFKVELDALGEALPITPPKKCVSTKQSRKRKRSKEEVSSIEMGQYHHTYVMKLFDRSVDLAQFDENSPLYPICRAWMKNQPHNRGVNSGERSMVLDLPTIPLDDDEDEGNIYKLDSPQQIKTEDGHFLGRSLPSPVPQPEERLDIHADESEALPGEDLLSTHMHRWREIRQKWKDAARKNEAFYAPSLDMLKDMFDRHCKD